MSTTSQHDPLQAIDRFTFHGPFPHRNRIWWGRLCISLHRPLRIAHQLPCFIDIAHTLSHETHILVLAVAPRTRFNSPYSSPWNLSVGTPIFYENEKFGHAGKTRSQEIKKWLWYMPSSKSKSKISPSPPQPTRSLTFHQCDEQRPVSIKMINVQYAIPILLGMWPM